MKLSLYEKLHTLCEPVLNSILNIEHWIAYRTYDKYHIIKTDLEFGYHEVEDQMLYGMFSLLNSYVEIQLAHMNRLSDFNVTNEDLPKSRFKRMMYLCIPKVLRNRRSRKLGLEQLDWQISLTPEQGVTGPDLNWYKDNKEMHQEIKDLYLWWNDIRPSRIDPDDRCGYTSFYEEMLLKYKDTYKLQDSSFRSLMGLSNMSLEESDKFTALVTESMNLEEQDHLEDTEMLIRLIKIRRSLWT